MTGQEQEETARRLADALHAEASSYAVSPGALHRLQARTRRRRAPRRLALAAGATALTGVTALAVLPSGSGPTPARPETLAATPTGATGTGPARTPSPLPAAVTMVTTLQPGFTVERTVLAGDDAYVFGATADHHPRAARVDLSGAVPRVVVRAALPGQVCSGSLDGGLLVVVLADPARHALPTDCARRGTVRVLDSRTLAPVDAVPTRARGGDVLVRPEGVYAVDAGTLRLLDRRTLAPVAERRVADPEAIVNLAGDPRRPTVYVTALAAQRTRVAVVTRRTLAGPPALQLPDAQEGGLAYATGTGFWLPFNLAGGTRVLRFDDRGARRAEAFAGAARGSSFALSGSRLWSLDVATGALSCADLVTGGVQASSVLPATGALAADRDRVLEALPAGGGLRVLAPTGACR